MEFDRATKILKSLAYGRDPATGEQFPLDIPYEQAKSITLIPAAVMWSRRSSGGIAGHFSHDKCVTRLTN